MTTRAQLKTILAEVLDLEESEVTITSANDDGDVKVEFASLFVDDTDDAETDDEVVEEEEEDTEDEKDAEVQEDADDSSDVDKE